MNTPFENRADKSAPKLKQKQRNMYQFVIGCVSVTRIILTPTDSGVAAQYVSLLKRRTNEQNQASSHKKPLVDGLVFGTSVPRGVPVKCTIKIDKIQEATARNCFVRYEPVR
ncbi:hypothetical protein GWI33_001833 [Rhynchophorus ferrugineus]|uniref:Uncharacterized protein n=1 Tax=Rhynchophorus ferrugineus TaxID=354439 RepID=A0A834MJW8_RHYFE|nr:hypothetical protein GWI33_001833 [Rhynchophorus ferrugineus]